MSLLGRAARKLMQTGGTSLIKIAHEVEVNWQLDIRNA